MMQEQAITFMHHQNKEQDMKKSSWTHSLKIIALLILALSSIAASSENLTAHFIDVGQGDSELIQFAGKNILIDGGEQEMGGQVESYLRNHGVTSLDLMVATHPHDDHIGGLITILKDFPIKQVLDSGQSHTTQTFSTYLNLIDQKNIPFETAQRGQTIDLDPAIEIEVLSPSSTLFQDDLNQNSIVLKVTYHNVSFLFMGDAGTQAESSLLSSGYNLDADILKVGHHGSSSASSTAFLSTVTPAISVIEVGSGNDYGHPTQKTLSALQNVGSKIYRTDTNGDITITTDGEGYTVTSEKRSWNMASTVPATSAITSSSSTLAATTTTATSSNGPFVGSSKSNKYHYPSCSAAKKIKPENLITFSSSEEARAQGYVPCGICHPP
jgi:beta-lactamase superfamily II metal-dependent hydrolase